MRLPKRGAKVRYRSIAGELLDAVVTGSSERGLVNIDVTCHPDRPDDILSLSRIKLAPKTRGAAWPKPKETP